jgi:hypothetical protein
MIRKHFPELGLMRSFGEKSGSSRGAMRAGTASHDKHGRYSLRKTYRAFPAAPCLSVRCYRDVTLLWQAGNGAFSEKKACPGLDPVFREHATD